jgi:hypothetical protein
VSAALSSAAASMSPSPAIDIDTPGADKSPLVVKPNTVGGMACLESEATKEHVKNETDRVQHAGRGNRGARSSPCSSLLAFSQMLPTCLKVELDAECIGEICVELASKTRPKLTKRNSAQDREGQAAVLST